MWAVLNGIDNGSDPATLSITLISFDSILLHREHRLPACTTDQLQQAAHLDQLAACPSLDIDANNGRAAFCVASCTFKPEWQHSWLHAKHGMLYNTSVSVKWAMTAGMGNQHGMDVGSSYAAAAPPGAPPGTAPAAVGSTPGGSILHPIRVSKMCCMQLWSVAPSPAQPAMLLLFAGGGKGLSRASASPLGSATSP